MESESDSHSTTASDSSFCSSDSSDSQKTNTKKKKTKEHRRKSDLGDHMDEDGVGDTVTTNGDTADEVGNDFKLSRGPSALVLVAVHHQRAQKGHKLEQNA